VDVGSSRSGAVGDDQPLMSDVAQAEDRTDAAPRRPLVLVLGAIITVAALLIAGTVGWLVRGDSGSAGNVSESSVDAGFARDMATHHEQAVTMATYARDNSTNPSVVLLASDIADGQKFEIGRMSGWLDDWGLSRNSALEPMAWMGGMSGHMHMDGGLMPGMATPAQMNELRTSKGTTLDILFLQLMIHHHQGGIPMAEYAVLHAKHDFVRTAASAMVTVQSNENIAMGQLLQQLGGNQLPPP